MTACAYCGQIFVKNSVSNMCSPKCKILGNSDRDSDCIMWKGKVGKNGYGHIKHGCKDFLTHRLMYLCVNGKIDNGLVVMHICNNRLCVNPDHLIAGTHQQNMTHAKNEGRMRGTIGRKWTQSQREKLMRFRRRPDKKGENHHMSYLSNEDVLEMKKMMSLGKKPKDILPIFGITRKHLYYIKSGKLWSHIKLSEEFV